MLVYFEKRERLGALGELYKVRTWYLFGLVPVLRRYEQLTCRGDTGLPSEMR
jgi:hypothetical protein